MSGDQMARLNRECLENLNATYDGDPAGNLINVLKRGFAAMGWAQPSLAADALIEALLNPAATPTPNGWQLVPTECTPDMVRAAPWVSNVRYGWKLMLAAAPQAQEGDGKRPSLVNARPISDFATKDAPDSRPDRAQEK